MSIKIKQKLHNLPEFKISNKEKTKSEEAIVNIGKTDSSLLDPNKASINKGAIAAISKRSENAKLLLAELRETLSFVLARNI